MNEQQILFEIAEGKTYETEYDGRMYTNCCFCDCCKDEYENHDIDCLMLKARTLLGDEWDRKVAQDKQTPANVLEFASYVPAHKVECEFCTKMVWYSGLKHHQRDSVRCNEIRQGTTA